MAVTRLAISCRAVSKVVRKRLRDQGVESPAPGQRRLQLADCVAKVFSAFRREILIQGQAGTRNNDSKEPALRFDSYKFRFHRARLATFATQSAVLGTREMSA